MIRSVPVADHVARYALRIVRSTRVRSDENDIPRMVRDYLSWGAGPRAGQSLIMAAKAKAILDGETHVMPEHIQAVAAFPREVNLYVAEIELSSFARQGPAN